MTSTYIWTGNEFVAASGVSSIRPAVKGATMGGGWEPRVVLVTEHAHFEVSTAEMIPDPAKAQQVALDSARSLAELLSRPAPGVAHADEVGIWHLTLDAAVSLDRRKVPVVPAEPVDDDPADD